MLLLLLLKQLLLLLVWEGRRLHGFIADNILAWCDPNLGVRVQIVEGFGFGQLGLLTEEWMLSLVVVIARKLLLLSTQLQ